MKSEVTTPEITGKPFPKLMISKKGTIVLFVSKDTGTVVKESVAHELGYSSRTWRYEDFTDFTGTVTLSND